jgi:MFS family permease
MEPSLLNIRLFSLPTLAAVIVFVSLFSVVFLMPFYLVHPSGFAIDKAGYMMVIPFISLFLVSPLSGTLSDRIGSRLLCTIGMMVLAAALLSLSRLTPSAATLDIAWRLALAGIGTAIFISPNSATVMSAVPAKRRGIAAGTVATARNLGMAIGVAQAGLIFNSTFYRLSGGLSLRVYRPDLESFFMAAFRNAMLAGGIVALVGVIIAYFRGPEKSRPGG